MPAVENDHPGKTWPELSPEELIEAIRHLGSGNFGRGGVNPTWLIDLVKQSTGEGGLNPEQAEEAMAIIKRLAPPRERGTVILK